MDEDFGPPPRHELPTPELVQVIPVPVPRRAPPGGVRFTVVEYWTTHVTFVFAEAHPRWRDDGPSPFDWRLEDDIGTTYFEYGAGRSGNDYMARGHVSYWPPPPTQARVLRLVDDGDRAGTGSVVLTLHLPPE